MVRDTLPAVSNFADFFALVSFAVPFLTRLGLVVGHGAFQRRCCTVNFRLYASVLPAPFLDYGHYSCVRMSLGAFESPSTQNMWDPARRGQNPSPGSLLFSAMTSMSSAHPQRNSPAFVTQATPACAPRVSNAFLTPRISDNPSIKY